MPVRYLLDTNTVSFHIRQSSGALQRRLRRTRADAVGPLDLMIASHALALGTTLITSHLDEFRRVPGLKCVDWTR